MDTSSYECKDYLVGRHSIGYAAPASFVSGTYGIPLLKFTAMATYP
jgi:hypothetical protein